MDKPGKRISRKVCHLAAPRHRMPLLVADAQGNSRLICQERLDELTNVGGAVLSVAIHGHNNVRPGGQRGLQARFSSGAFAAVYLMAEAQRACHARGRLRMVGGTIIYNNDILISVGDDFAYNGGYNRRFVKGGNNNINKLFWTVRHI